MIVVVGILSLFILNFVRCTIDGLSYLDEFKYKDLFNNLPKKDKNPCNPLFWYPKQIPDYCHIPKFLNPPNVKLEPLPKPPKPPMPQMPIPSPIVAPMLPAPIIPSPMGPPPMISSPIIPSPMVPSPMVPSLMIPPRMIPSSMVASHMIPSPMGPSPPSVLSPLISSPLTHGASLMTNSMISVIPHNPYTGLQNPQYPLIYGQQNAGMVPGLPGIVTRDGGINILPFSDAYSDLLEKHKQKVIRRKLQKVLKRYEDYPRPKNFWRSKRFKHKSYDYE